MERPVRGLLSRPRHRVIRRTLRIYLRRPCEDDKPKHARSTKSIWAELELKDGIGDATNLDIECEV